MSKTIEVKGKWAGTVEIADPLNFSQVDLIQDGFENNESKELEDARKNYFSYVKEHGDTDEESTRLRLILLEVAEKNRQFHSIADKRQLPAILACVEKWNLSGIPEKPTMESFPASPRKDSHKLIESIFTEILNVYRGANEVPNE